MCTSEMTLTTDVHPQPEKRSRRAKRTLACLNKAVRAKTQLRCIKRRGLTSKPPLTWVAAVRFEFSPRTRTGPKVDRFGFADVRVRTRTGP